MKSDSIGKLAGALAKAQGAMSAAIKDSTVKVQMKSGGSYTAKFATLASVFDAIRDPFSANGLAVSQIANVRTEINADHGPYAAAAVVTTILMHESGEWLRSETQMPIDKEGPHAVGAAISFAKRYALGAICGLATDDDNDGNEAQGSTQSFAVTRKPDFSKPVSREDMTRPWQKPDAVWTITSGDGRGLAFREATDDQLHAFGRVAQGVLDDPAKAAHRERAIKTLNAIEDELVGRRK